MNFGTFFHVFKFGLKLFLGVGKLSLVVINERLILMLIWLELGPWAWLISDSDDVDIVLVVAILLLLIFDLLGQLVE